MMFYFRSRKVASTGILAVLLAVVVVFLYCVQQDIPNPLLPRYEGDYKLDAFFVNKKDTVTVYVFTPVPIQFNSTGKDTFSLYKLECNPSDLIDPKKSNPSKGDTLFAYFTKPFTGTIKVIGVRPNGKEVEVSLQVIVKNRFSLSVDTITIDGDSDVKFKVTDNLSDTTTKVYWFVNDTLKDSTTVGSTFSQKADLFGSFKVQAIVKDIHSSVLSLDTLTIVTHGSKPVISDVTFPDSIFIGDTISVTVNCTDSESVPNRIIVTAGNDTLYEDREQVSFADRRSIIFSNPLLTLGSVMITFSITDTTGLSSTYSKKISVKSTNPSVSITEDTLFAPLGKPFTITVSTYRADSLHWRTIRKKIDTVTTVPQLTITYDDTLNDTIIVTAKDRYMTGISDTVVITPRAYKYDLVVDSFPLVVKAKRWNSWIVKANLDNNSVSGMNYNWSFSPDSLWDSAHIDGGTCSLYVSKAVKFTIGVEAFSGDGSACPKTSGVSVTYDRPVVTVPVKAYTNPINTPLSIGVSAHDSNRDGTVTIYYQLNHDTTHPIKGDSIKTNCETPGDNVIRVWAVDNDDFISDTAIITVNVTTKLPRFVKPQKDTAVYIYDSVRISAEAIAGNTNDTVVLWNWDFDNDGIWEETTTVDHYDTNFQSPGNPIIKIRCKNTQGDWSKDPAIRNINVVAGSPVVDTVGISNKKIFIKGIDSLRISAHDTNGRVQNVTVRAGSLQIASFTTDHKSIDTIITVSFPDSGVYRFTVIATDEDGQRSTAYSVKDSLIVDQGIPAVTSVIPKTVFPNVKTIFTISAKDNGRITGYAVAYKETAFSEWSTDSTFTYTFSVSDTGKQYFRVKLQDNDSNELPLYSDTVVVKAGYPSITGVTLKNHEDLIYINDTLKCEVSASDLNKVVKRLYVDWNNDANADDSYFFQDSINVKHIFKHKVDITDTGTNVIQFWAMDNDSLLSPLWAQIATIRLGKPVVNKVTKDSTKIYIYDAVTYSVNSSDSNGTIDTAFVDWNGDDSADESVTPQSNSALMFKHVFLPKDTVTRNMQFWVSDNDGILSNKFSYPIVVLSGKPVIDSITIGTKTDSLFVKDSIKYRVYFSDVNGIVKNVFAFWENGSTPVDWIKIDSSQRGVREFTYMHDTADTGSHTMKFRVIDDDQQLSDFKDTTFTVRKGEPVLTGDKGDTLWVVIDSSHGRNYPIRINHFDTNGTIVNYYWNESGPSLGRSTTTDTILRNFSQADMHFSLQFWIYGRDDDSIVRGKQFVVFADSVPRTISANSDSVFGGRKISWSGMDKKDSLATEYRILAWIGLSPDTSENSPDIVKDWTAGSDTTFHYAAPAVLDGNTFYWMYTPLKGFGKYCYKIISRDARGSKNYSSPGLNFQYTQ